MLEMQERKRKRKKEEEVDLPEKRKVADIEAPEENHRTKHHRNGKTSSKHGERV
jgi:hypothetical protein